MNVKQYRCFGKQLGRSISIPEYISQVTKNKCHTKKKCASMFIQELLLIAQRIQPKCPSTDEWIKRKRWCVYTVQHYSVIKGRKY
jgi:hypothetical protein